MKFLIILLSLFSIATNAQYNYPVPPKTEVLLFYIQRNHNENTIMYDAKYLADGNLDPKKPIDSYWMRYQEDSTRKELKWLDKKAYGIHWKSIDGNPKEFDVELVADESRKFTLKQLGPNKSVLYTTINDLPAEIEHLWIQADNSGMWPTVLYIELFGFDVKTKKPVYEKMIVDD